jgi:ABC-type branched-subunit amino acid transport system ATPase component
MQTLPGTPTRRRIEKEAESRHGAATNYFQEKTTLVNIMTGFINPDRRASLFQR